MTNPVVVNIELRYRTARDKLHTINKVVVFVDNSCWTILLVLGVFEATVV